MLGCFRRLQVCFMWERVKSFVQTQPMRNYKIYGLENCEDVLMSNFIVFSFFILLFNNDFIDFKTKLHVLKNLDSYIYSSPNR